MVNFVEELIDFNLSVLVVLVLFDSLLDAAVHLADP